MGNGASGLGHGTITTTGTSSDYCLMSALPSVGVSGSGDCNYGEARRSRGSNQRWLRLRVEEMCEYWKQ